MLPLHTFDLHRPASPTSGSYAASRLTCSYACKDLIHHLMMTIRQRNAHSLRSSWVRASMIDLEAKLQKGVTRGVASTCSLTFFTLGWTVGYNQRVNTAPAPMAAVWHLGRLLSGRNVIPGEFWAWEFLWWCVYKHEWMLLLSTYIHVYAYVSIVSELEVSPDSVKQVKWSVCSCWLEAQ